MIYQLPNGKVIEISTEQFIDMTDEELEYLIAYNYGEVQENPWFGSILSKSAPPDEIIEVVGDLTEIPDIDKINYLDIDYEIENDDE